MELRTKRLVLRQLRREDLPDLVENINNINVSKWLLVVPYPYTVKDAREYLRHTQKSWKVRNKKDYSFTIAKKEDNVLIGGCGIHKISKEQGTAEMGYWLGERYWRQGYGTEGMNAMIEFAFGKLGLRRINSGVFRGNPSSGKMQEKLGFKNEGLRRKGCVCKADGKIKDEYAYGLLKEEWIRL